jgi:Rad3-related DNA helicase
VNAVQKARVAAFAKLGREAAFRRVYQIPGIQKVNQALGRLVRAPGQHAKVLLHCRRFVEPAYAQLLAPEYQMGEHVTSQEDLANWLAM